MKTNAALLSAAVLIAGVAGLLFLAHAEPSTAALDADLTQVRSAVKAAEDESSQYQGGALKAFIDLRKQIYQTTEAMLVQKRESWLRRIDLKFSAEGRPIAPTDAEKVTAISDDIEKAQAKLAADEAKAAQYSGGLLQVMSLVTVETDRVSLSQLHMALYAAKYGMPLPVNVGRATSPTAGPPGAVVKDKDAF